MSPAFERFLRRVGVKYPHLHPDYDRDSQTWVDRRRAAELAIRRERPCAPQS